MIAAIIALVVVVVSFGAFIAWALWPVFAEPSRTCQCSECDDEQESEYSIEFYPINQVYYPKHLGSYLSKNHWTGIIERERHLWHGDKFTRKGDAASFLRKYQEQRTKKNVEVIQVDLDSKTDKGE